MAATALALGLGSAVISSGQSAMAGTWTPLKNGAPSGINLMLLLTDGTVMCQAAGATNQWWRLTPDAKGSYVNGTWTALASMHDTRLYGESQVLPDGRVFIGGGEYGSGRNTAEVYDPLTDKWTMTPDAGQEFSDANSEILPNGDVLVSPVGPSTFGGTVIWHILTNIWTPGPQLFRGYYQDEATWVKLPDDSILTIDPFGTNSERYIPSLNKWIDDGIVPDQLYDPNLSEMGAGLLMPNGKVVYFGSTGHTAIYTPTGNLNPGTWVAGPDIPNGMGQPDAPAAIMPNGKIILTVSPQGTFDAPTTFYEYDPGTNAFTQISGPRGLSEGYPAYVTRFLDLPDGTIMYSDGGSQVYTYDGGGAPQTAWRPKVLSAVKNSDGTYSMTGYQLTGISEGACYGDDVQMETNYPIVRLTDATGNIFYCRTYNWSDTGVAKGTTVQSAQFQTPPGLPAGSYTYTVIANGISSAPFIIGKPLPPPASISANFAGNAITVSWASVPTATAYRVFRSTTSGAETLYVGSTASLSYVDTNVKAKTTYYYKVCALVPPAAQGDLSAEASATAQGPNAPASVTATPISGGVNLAWSAVPYATIYNVLRATASAGPFGIIARPSSLKFTDADAKNGITYWYQIQGVDNVGPGTPSVTVSATPNAAYAAPPTPTGVTAVASAGSIALTWPAVIRATSYVIRRATAAAGGYTVIGTTVTPGYTDKTTVAGKTYYYTVAATNSYGTSQPSAYTAAVAK